jgi:heat-inducible transcriptional repressor
MVLSDRKLKILQAIIDDYIDTGVPVGSRTLSKKGDINYSSATIRNEMADLEEMGFLDKPHTSAGRTPSDLAYRLYVDRMMQIGVLNRDEMAFIQRYFDRRLSEIDQVLDTAAKAISGATNQIALISSPKMNSVKINRIQIVKITDAKALLVLVADNGLLQDSMISIPPKMDVRQMELLSNMITDALRNVEMDRAGERLKEMAENTLTEQRQIMDEVFEAMNVGIAKRDMILEGAQNILKHPEYKDINKAQHLMTLLDTKDRLYDLLSGSRDLEFSIRIGSENAMEDFNDMSVVTATYKVGGKDVGTFGIIGPTRMNYARVISVLNYVGKSLNEILSCFVEGNAD